MKVYISGGITGIEDYMSQFDDAERSVRKLYSDEVINPAKIGVLLPKSTTYDQFMRMSYMLLNQCDHIWMIPGWEKSTGACIEYGYALAKGICILNVPDELQGGL